MLTLSGPVVTAGTFALGYSLAVGPLLQEGEVLGTALLDTLWSENTSITVSEMSAIGTDLLLAGDAGPGHVLFWSAFVLSLTVGFVAAHPVNLGLIGLGVKEAMGNPAAMG